MSIELGLIGQKISQSKSPALQNMLGQIHGLDVNYQLQERDSPDESEFATTLQSLIARGFSGTNVTFPYKQVALKYATSKDRAAQRVGATNCMRFKQGEVLATNTDYTGFIGAYNSRREGKAAGSVLLLGAGGVGRAVAFALQELNVKTIHVFDLNSEGAQALVDALNADGISAVVTTPAELDATSQQVEGLINCTPIGHKDSPGNPLPAHCFGGQSWAFDAVYVPIDTEFLTCAKQAGLDIISGFDLFLYQAVDSFIYFTERSVDFAEVTARFVEHERIHSDLVSF